MPPRPRKRFGQHFLTDPDVCRTIAAAVAARGRSPVVEIGPGRGALTKALLAAGLGVRAIELDRDLVPGLRRAFADRDFAVSQGDALRADFEALGAAAPLAVCGNLPYNISSPLLFRLAELKDTLDSLTFMLQAEVVDRILAYPGSKAYGRLTVMLQYDFGGEVVVRVPPAAFSPPPAVDSSVVQLLPHRDQTPLESRSIFAEVVQRSFAQRRKTLRNALKGCADPADLEAAGIDPAARAESVAVAGFVNLANRLARAHGGATAEPHAPVEDPPPHGSS